MADEKTSKDYQYTVGQELYCYLFVELDCMSAAYRQAFENYTGSDNTIYKVASNLNKQEKIQVKIKEIRELIFERNKMTLSELVHDLAKMVRFDMGDLYDENSRLKPVKDMPKAARQMLTGLKTTELYANLGGDKIPYGETKEVKFYSKLDAIDKLMRHLGGYEKDNEQQRSEVVVFELPDNKRPLDGDEATEI